MTNIPDEICDAVIEKWLTYTKTQNLNEFMVWRLHLMKRIYSTRETIALKIILRERRIADEKAVCYKDKKGGGVSKDIKKYGKQIKVIYPLLDPEIKSNLERKE